jgi:hypothetical protein
MGRENGKALLAKAMSDLEGIRDRAYREIVEVRKRIDAAKREVIAGLIECVAWCPPDVAEMAEARARIDDGPNDLLPKWRFRSRFGSPVAVVLSFPDSDSGEVLWSLEEVIDGRTSLRWCTPFHELSEDTQELLAKILREVVGTW